MTRTRTTLWVTWLAALLLVPLVPRLTAAAEISPQNLGSDEFARAQKAQESGDYHLAETAYLNLLRLNKESLPVQFNLGVTYYLDHKYAESSFYLLKVLATKPDLFAACLITGVDFLKLGQPNRAIRFLRSAQRLQPTDEYANHNLGTAEYLAGHYRAAFGEYVSFLRSEEKGGKTAKDILSWYGLGEVALVLSREASTQLGERSTSDPSRLYLLATMYRDQEQWDLAAVKLKKLETNPLWRDLARLELGELYLRRNDLAQADIEFRSVLSSTQDSPRAHFGLGIKLLREGNTSGAIPHLVAAAERNPWLFGNSDLLAVDGSKIYRTAGVASSSPSALVDVFVRLRSQSKERTSEEQLEFISELEAACKRRHQDNKKRISTALRAGVPAGAVMRLAATLLDEGDAAAVSELLGKLPNKLSVPPNPRIILLARSLMTEGDALTSGSVLLPLLDRGRSPEALCWTAIIMQQIAKAALEQVLSIAADSALAHLLRAQMESAQHRTDAAIREFQLAVQAAPDDATTHLRLGDMLWQVGQFEGAIQALREGLKLDPENAAAYYQIGDSYLSLANSTLARNFLLEALRRDPHMYGANRDLGRIYYNEGKFQESVIALQKAAIDDSDGSVDYLLFRSYSKLGKNNAAAACLKRFQKLKALRENKNLFDAKAAHPERSE